MDTITHDQVTRSYNGASGCMCGCKGKYTLPSHADINKANVECGYMAYDKSDVSDRRVKIAVNKVNAALVQYEDMLSDGEYHAPNVNVGRNADFAWADINGRNTVVYF